MSWGVPAQKGGAVTSPCCISSPPVSSPGSLCPALQVHREDHGGDGAVVSSGHHPTLCQQPRSGGAHLPRAELQPAGARPAKPPAPLLVSPTPPALTSSQGEEALRRSRALAKTRAGSLCPSQGLGRFWGGNSQPLNIGGGIPSEQAACQAAEEQVLFLGFAHFLLTKCSCGASLSTSRGTRGGRGVSVRTGLILVTADGCLCSRKGLTLPN